MIIKQFNVIVSVHFQLTQQAFQTPFISIKYSSPPLYNLLDFHHISILYPKILYLYPICFFCFIFLPFLSLSNSCIICVLKLKLGHPWLWGQLRGLIFTRVQSHTNMNQSKAIFGFACFWVKKKLMFQDCNMFTWQCI